MELRPPADDGERAVANALWNRLLPRRAHTLTDFLAWRDSCLDTFELYAWEEHALAGTVSLGIEAARPYPILRLVVEPDRRGHGIGGALFDAASAWACERDRHELETWIDDDQAGAIAFVRRRGFEMVNHDETLELDLRGYDPPRVEPPPGIQVVRWAERPDLARGIYDVACEAYVDIPGEEDLVMEPYEDWLAHDMQGPGDTPEAVFVALAGDEVVGYSKFSLTEALPTVAFHDLTGVKRPWRGRGIARALKAAQVAWAKEQGYEKLETRNEDRNIPIKRLNEEFGYEAGIGRGTYRGPVSS
jgi:GNAT superfamily N-acetyltransferase